MKKTAFTFLSWFILTILLVACNSTTPTSLPPTAAPTVAPTQTASPTITPTATPEPIVFPRPRGYHSMAYDSKFKQVILYGGQVTVASQEPIFDTWAFDPAKKLWRKMAPATSPEGAFGDMVYDPKADQAIFVAVPVNNNSASTWAYDFNTDAWEQRANYPGFRIGTRLAYDAESDKVISFGGLGYFDQTWAYDFNTDTWTQMQPETSPRGRNFHCMAYDSKADKIVLWGGDELDWKPTQWAYDYNTNTWTQLTYASGPEIKYYCILVYDEGADKFILYGGNKVGADGTDETWIYDLVNNIWEQLQPAKNPGIASRHAMVFDRDLGTTILFGGQAIIPQIGLGYTDKTWGYDLKSNTWEQLAP